jgi:hypothetical protein
MLLEDVAPLQLTGMDRIGQVFTFPLRTHVHSALKKITLVELNTGDLDNPRRRTLGLVVVNSRR